jgi:hypothetical protein|tara:strand:- start:417 stop:1046 length:630 start_codon:yes stop_codon:yes gene_type:complete
MFKFNYKVGKAIPRVECQVILRDLERQSDKFSVTDAFGNISLSVYESDYDDIEMCDGKKLMNYRIKQLEKDLGVKFNKDRFIIKYTGDRLEMEPHYDGSYTTTLIYLNTNFEGGSTNFPLANLEHRPQDFKPGHYIHYNSNHILSYHGGMPVTNGNKTVIVLRSFKITLWTMLTILPWRLFRDVFFERFILDWVVKRFFTCINCKRNKK